MKKIILASLLTACFTAPSFAAEGPGYLISGSNQVVKSGFGLCWNTSAPKLPTSECGDKIEQPKIATPAPKPVVELVFPAEKSKQVIRAKIVVNASVLFKFDSFLISDSGKKALDQQVIALNPQKVEIAGHTDRIGSEKYNLKLSLKRASAVKSYLVSKGLKEDSVTAQGFGESQLLCKEKTKACDAQNRRVEINAEYLK